MVTSGGENRRGDTEGTELHPEMGLDLYKETGKKFLELGVENRDCGILLQTLWGCCTHELAVAMDTCTSSANDQAS